MGAPLGVRLALVLGLAAFGLAAILVRFAGDTPGLVVAVWRTAFAALIVAPAALSGEVRGEWRRLSVRDLALIVIAGVLLAAHFVGWIVSLSYTSVASTSVLVTMSPLFIAILSAVFLRERLARRSVVAVLAGVAGAVLIGWGDAGGAFPRAALGNALALGAALLVSVYLLIGRAVRQRVSLVAYLVPLYVVVGVVTMGAALVLGAPVRQPPYILGLCFLLALGPSILGHGSFNLALRYYPAAFLGLLSLAEPVIASAVAAALFGEIPSARAMLGMGVVLGAIAFEIAGASGWRPRLSRRTAPPGGR